MMEMVSKSRLGAAEIAGILRRQIGLGELPAKERLPAERHLATTYGVSRGTIRAALTRLADDGLVEIRSGSGTYVIFDQETGTNPAIANARPLELMDARFALEPHICRLAVLHARSNDLSQAADLLRSMEESVEDPVAFSLSDTAFHTLLVEITGNGLLIWMMSQISSVRNQDQWSRMRRMTLNGATIRHYNHQHRRIFEAIRAREPELAASIMKEHLETARTTLTRAAAT